DAEERHVEPPGCAAQVGLVTAASDRVDRRVLDEEERLRAAAAHRFDLALLKLERACIVQPAEVDDRERTRDTLWRRAGHHTSTSRSGASSISFSVFRNCAASAPSITRWSEESVTRIVGRAA